MRPLSRAIRMLCSTPIASAGALLVLTVGVGTNVAAFSLFNALLLRPLPVRDPDRLVTVSSDQAIRLGFPAGAGWSYGMWSRLRPRAGIVEGATAWYIRDLNLSSRGQKDVVSGVVASGEFFRSLGLDLAVGRPFGSADDVRGGGPVGPVAVISDRLWQQRYDRAPDAIGRALNIEGTPFSIVGVLPASFLGLEVGRPVDVILPLETEPLLGAGTSVVQSNRALLLIVILRLWPGQSLDSATTGLRALQPEILGSDNLPAFLSEPFVLVGAPGGTSGAEPGVPGLRARYGRAATTLFAIVLLVLLAACANVANVQLARTQMRLAELRLRYAIGASRARLVGLLTFEATVLVGLAAVLGVLLGGWASRLTLAELLATEEARLALFPDLVTGLFVAVLVAMMAVAIGLMPALRLTAGSLMADSRLRGATSGRAGSYWLVAVQVAISVVLLVGAAAFVHTVRAAAAVPLGYQPERLTLVALDVPRNGIEERGLALLGSQLLESMAALPGIERAAQSTSAPGLGGLTKSVPSAEGVDLRVRVNAVSAGWFSTYGTRIRAGRAFAEADTPSAPAVAIVNEALAAVLWPAQPAVGNTVDGRMVVGVAENQIGWGGYTPDGTARPINAPPTSILYVPIAQAGDLRPPGSARLLFTARLARADAPFPAVALDRTLAALDPAMSYSLRGLAADARAGLSHQRILATLSTAFGIMALIIAAVGTYSVVANDVARQQRQIGIRLALGAAPNRLRDRIARRAAVPVGAGVVAGLVASFWLRPFAASLLTEFDAKDWATPGVAGVVVVGISLLAAYLPAARLCRTEPALLLRRSE